MTRMMARTMNHAHAHKLKGSRAGSMLCYAMLKEGEWHMSPRHVHATMMEFTQVVHSINLVPRSFQPRMRVCFTNTAVNANAYTYACRARLQEVLDRGVRPKGDCYGWERGGVW